MNVRINNRHGHLNVFSYWSNRYDVLTIAECDDDECVVNVAASFVTLKDAQAFVNGRNDVLAVRPPSEQIRSVLDWVNRMSEANCEGATVRSF